MGNRSRGKPHPDLEIIPLKNGEIPKFAMYARKSTDESSNKQMASIPQQIECCMEYVEHEGILMMIRTPEWEIDKKTIEEIKADNKASLSHAEKLINFYTTHLIITERDSGLKPHKRKLWGKLISEIRAGKIRGLLGYAPDRFARNLVEGGELIQLVDDGTVALKFKNFHFENNAAGQMMLGFWFVFAEHYSKKLSEDSTRGSRKTHLEGCAGGVRKFGYSIDNNDRFIPDELHFKLVKQAFEYKLQGWSDGKIADELNKQGWCQLLKGSDEKKIAGRKLTAAIISQNQLWEDRFYCGMFIRTFNNDEVNVNLLQDIDDTEWKFTPVITEAEWFELQEKLSGTRMAMVKKRKSQRGKINLSIKPIPDDGFLRFRTKDNEELPMNHMLPNKHRFEAKMKKTGKELWEIIQPHQIEYRCQNSDTYRHIKIKWDKLDDMIATKLKKIQITEHDYQAYLHALKRNLEGQHKINKADRKRETLLENKAESELDAWRKKTNYGVGTEGKNRESWEQEEKRLELAARQHTKNKQKIDQEFRDEMLEKTAFVETTKNLSKYWRDANYVQKRELIEKMVLNMTLTGTFGLEIALKPELEGLFILDGGQGQN